MEFIRQIITSVDGIVFIVIGLFFAIIGIMLGVFKQYWLMGTSTASGQKVYDLEYAGKYFGLFCVIIWVTVYINPFCFQLL